MRVEFDATLDELVDVNMRLAEHTVAFRRQRLWSQAFVGGCLTVALVATVIARGGLLPPTTVAIVVGGAVVGGVLLGYLYGHFHNWYIRRNYRQMVNEMLGGAESVRCEFEPRPDVLWCRTTSVEMSFAWSRLKRVHDEGSSVELWFDPGLAVVRNRAFLRAEDRRDFIEAVTKFSGAKAGQQPIGAVGGDR